MAMTNEQAERAVAIHYEIETTGSTTASVEEVQANVRMLAQDFEQALAMLQMAMMLGMTDRILQLEQAAGIIGHVGEILSNYLESIGVVPDLPQLQDNDNNALRSIGVDADFLRSIGIDPDAEFDPNDVSSPNPVDEFDPGDDEGYEY